MENNTSENFTPPDPSKLMTKMVLVAAVIIIVIGAIFYRSLAAVPFAMGVLITSWLNIYKIRMLERTVRKVMDMDDQEAGKNTVRFQYLLRYAMTGAVLVIVGIIQNYTIPPPIYSDREIYIAVWATLFPNAPETLLNAPLINILGAVAGIFTLQLSIFLIRFMKLEKDGENFIEYKDETEVSNHNIGGSTEPSNKDDEES
ncbi:MAG: hypothetical protein LBD23_17140 [Oscillospiraceae bacterium]|nr:hypothetical protein [Oscillospiraceae bacterium]